MQRKRNGRFDKQHPEQLAGFWLLMLCVSMIGLTLGLRSAGRFEVLAISNDRTLNLPEISHQAVSGEIVNSSVELEKGMGEVLATPAPTIAPLSEHQQILSYIIEKFGDDADEAIAMIRVCENSTFAPDRVSGLNIQKSGRRSYDIGVMQINVDELNTAEIERLKDWKYNIDRGYAKYVSAKKTFKPWSCAPSIGQKNYLGQ